MQSAGYVTRFSAGVLKREFQQHRTLQHLTQCSTKPQITQLAQTAVCNRHHSNAGRIHYNRGHIIVGDHPELESLDLIVGPMVTLMAIALTALAYRIK